MTVPIKDPDVDRSKCLVSVAISLAKQGRMEVAEKTTELITEAREAKEMR